jgi:hypothetical protein
MSWLEVLGGAVAWAMARSARLPALLVEIACAALLIALLRPGRGGGSCGTQLR